MFIACSLLLRASQDEAPKFECEYRRCFKLCFVMFFKCAKKLGDRETSNVWIVFGCALCIWVEHSFTYTQEVQLEIIKEGWQ